METKKQIRKELLGRRDALTMQEHKEMSAQMIKRLETLPEFAEALQILFFVSYGSEPDTLGCMQQCFQRGKRVFCPLVTGDTMEFYEIKSLSELADGYRGIKEPKPLPERKYVPGKKDFMLVPGAVFDMEGNRIGYGKGFYDRYFAGGYKGEKAALAFSFQIVECGRIPAEETDQKINCIVTEADIYRI